MGKKNKAITHLQFDNFVDTLVEAIQDSIFYGADLPYVDDLTTTWAKKWGPILLKQIGITLIEISTMTYNK